MSTKTIWWLVIFFVGAAPLTLSWFLHPDPRGLGTHEQLGLPPCPLHFFTKLPCPSCGLTTSLTQLTHGHVLAAILTHPIAPLLVVLWLMALIVLPKSKPGVFHSPPIRFVINFGLIGWLVFWLVKLLGAC